MKLVDMFLPTDEGETGNGAGSGLVPFFMKGRGCWWVEEGRAGLGGAWSSVTTGCFLDGFLTGVALCLFSSASINDLEGRAAWDLSTFWGGDPW